MSTRRTGSMVRRLSMATAVIMVIVSGCGKEELSSFSNSSGSKADRVISVSPSTTEIMFSLGLGGSLVAVSRFCQLPAGCDSVESIGGYLDPNYEKIASLDPDLVLLLPEQKGISDYLERLDIATLTIDNKTVEDILAGISVLGETFNVKERADSLVGSLNARVENVRKRMKDSEKIPVLISIGHAFGSGKAQEVFAAGKGTYYSQLIEIAGGENVCSTSSVAFPAMSAEGLISIDPHIIIELIPVSGMEGMSDEQIVAEWNCLSAVTAVRDKRVYVIRKDYSHIPGPRFILLLEEFADIIEEAGE